MSELNISNMTISEIKAFPDTGDAFISLLEKDSRKGVRDYARVLRRRKKREREILEKTLKLREMELNLEKMGYRFIAGLDEVGRGPLAGPVMAGAVIMPLDKTIAGVNDSKKLSKSKREVLSERIKKEAISFSCFEISNEEIDRINILNATKQAMIGAVNNLTQKPEILLIDALELKSGIEELSIIDGDAKCYAIGAASIVAKVERDRIMSEYAKIYPQYGFDHNAGYGTREHIEAIRKYGLTPIHRRSFCYKFTSF